MALFEKGRAKTGGRAKGVRRGAILEFALGLAA
jgi:hypothetical protein